MKTSIKDLKDHLSFYLKKVQNGEEMIITFHDKPIAKIIPFSNPTLMKSSRKEWAKKIHSLHKSLGKIKSKKPMSKTVIELRKAERY